LKYPPISFIHKNSSGIWDLDTDSNRPCNSWRRYWATAEPPCLNHLNLCSAVT
jgi:hypothetical protein